MSEKFYITTAIAYTSKKPHLGKILRIVPVKSACIRLGEETPFCIDGERYLLKGCLTAEKTKCTARLHIISSSELS